MLKRFLTAMMAGAMLMSYAPAVSAENADKKIYKQFYVAVNGNDNADGSQSAPFASIKRAKEAVRAISADMSGDIIVNIGEGTYYQKEMIDFTNEDSGKNGYNIIYRGEDGKHPEISGAKRITMQRSAEYPELLEAYLPDQTYTMREFYVDGDKKILAKSSRFFTPSNYKREGSEFASDGIVVNKNDLTMLSNLEDVEFTWYRAWIKMMIRPKTMTETKDGYIISFSQPFWGNEIKNGYDTRPSPTVKCYAQNAFELLDEPGEFYYNRKTKKLYYFPEEGESEDSVFAIPLNDTAVFIMGESVDNRVENITFEGLKFTGYTIENVFDEGNMTGQGPTYQWANNRTIQNDFGIIYINRAKNINFYNNRFTGLGMTAINMKDAVSDCEVIGNAFYDNSKGAIEIGDQYHIEFDFGRDDPRSTEERFKVNYTVEENPKTDFNMQLLQPYVEVSSNALDLKHITMVEETATQFNFYPHQSFKTTSVDDLADVDLYGSTKSWVSSKESAAAGEKAWVKYDFVRKYTINEIALVFDTELIPEEQRNNYEVLLSNDPEFKTYKTVATVTLPSGNILNPSEKTAKYAVEDFKITDSEKYRYVMVRTLGATQLGLTHVHMFTPDIRHQIVREMCENINFSNNYVTRCADDEISCVPVFVFAGDELKFTHNDISDLPYSGFSIGLNWGFYGQCGRFDLTDNYIHNTNKLGYDGGAIYTLGNHQGSTIERNYLNNTHGGVAIYLDNGTTGVYVNENIDEMSRYTMTENNGAQDNVIHDLYTAKKEMDINGTRTLFTGAQTEYTIGNEPARAAEIKLKAGLEEGYKHIKAYADEDKTTYSAYDGFSVNCPIVTHRHPVYHQGVVTAANNMLSGVTFGYGYGKYPTTAMYKLQELKNYSETTAYNSVSAAELLTEVIKSQRRYPIDELIGIAEARLAEVKSVSKAALENTAENAVTTDVYDKLKAELAEVKKAYEGGKADYIKLLERLETALNIFESAMSKPYIEDAYMAGAACTVDNENKTIEIMVTKNTNLELLPEIYPAQNTVIAGTVDKLKAGREYNLAICSKTAGRYEFYKLIVKEADVENVISPAKITTDSLVDGIITEGADGKVTFQGVDNKVTYYNSEKINSSQMTTVKFTTPPTVFKNDYTFLIGAEDLKGFNPGSTDAKYDRVELRFYNHILYVYGVANGRKTLFSRSIADLNYNFTENTLSYQLTKEGSGVNLKLIINGKSASYYISGVEPGGAFGFYSNKNSITLY